MIMRIDGINPVNPIQPEEKPGRANRVKDVPQSDSISISLEAAQKAELYRAIELVKAAPDVRMDRVEELRAKINDPAYINDKVVNATADRIFDAFFG